MIDAFYEVEYIKPFDRNESYYSHYYNYCLINGCSYASCVIDYLHQIKDNIDYNHVVKYDKRHISFLFISKTVPYYRFKFLQIIYIIFLYLSYGVMVAQEILVLLVQVRILV